MNADTKPLNHACFEAVALDILSRAYESFPAPISIDFEKDCETSKESGKVPSHCKVKYTHYHSLYGCTFEFLEREGLLHAKEQDHIDANGVTLTSKGFLLLNEPMSLTQRSTEHSTTIGEHLKTAGKKTGSLAASETMKFIVKWLLTNQQ